MASVETDGHYETAGGKPSSATKTDVLTCPVAGGMWYTLTGINICASDGSAGTADILVYDATAAVEYAFRKGVTVPAAGALAITDVGPLVLKAGDVLRVTPSAANQHVLVSYMVTRRTPGRSAGAGR